MPCSSRSARPRADAARIAALAAAPDVRLGIGGKPTEAERLHVSLFGLVDDTDRYPAEAVEQWMNALDIVRVAPFEVVFDTVATFGGQTRPRVLRSLEAAPVAGVRQLHAAVGEALATSGEKLKWSSDEPHMTASYNGRRIVDTSIAPIAWTAGEFALIGSHVGAHLDDVLAGRPLRA